MFDLKHAFFTRSFVLLIIVSFLSCQSNSTRKLTIATAANAQFAVEAIVREFEKETGLPCQIIIGSSGKHTAQIEAGAPYDVFISADIKFPDRLYELNLTMSEPAVYAYGSLVIWTLDDSLSTRIINLTASKIQNIAIPNPKTAPYGRAASEAIDFYGLSGKIGPRLVYGESVTQANQFILSTAADIGFTAASIVMAPKMKSKGKWQAVEKNAYTPITQAAVVIKQTTQPVAAKKFYLFLFSPTAKKILQAYGYTTYKDSL
jgi:molybdate transport system substrate-binding protein